MGQFWREYFRRAVRSDMIATAGAVVRSLPDVGPEVILCSWRGIAVRFSFVEAS